LKYLFASNNNDSIIRTNVNMQGISLDMKGEIILPSIACHLIANFERMKVLLDLIYIGAREEALLEAFILARACSFKSALSPLAARLP